jgi:nicotinate-nucleotide pyrophosphorylase (carboxylating)
MSAGDGVPQLVRAALAEDLGAGDVTSEATVPADSLATARIVQKQPGVIFGLEVAAEVFSQAGAPGLEALGAEGVWRDEVPADVAALNGPARAVLAGERTALNFLAHLSGIATLSARFVQAVADTGAQVLDTRKTTPGLRRLEKAAVAAGGAGNHRLGLDDAVLIKENHVTMAGGIGPAVAAARAAQPTLQVEVECRDLGELAEALAAGADRVLLDNMAPEELRASVAERDRSGSDAKLEASGGVSLDNVAAIAATGVDFISVGALTHSAPALDLSMLIEARSADRVGVDERED